MPQGLHSRSGGHRLWWTPLFFVLITIDRLPAQETRAASRVADSRPRPEDREMTLEELMNIEVTSVARKEQKLADAPAAVFVITARDLERSGHTTIAEALRLAPGMQVARIDANKWAITARGFAGQFANKLLVLMDGRSVYTPGFAGVHWDVQDTLLQDVERIEVIRGPGGAMWGANAVNGVINVITKKASETQGGLAYSGVGSEERGFGGMRYGFGLGDGAHLRVYAKYADHDGQVNQAGNDTNDEWDMLRGGFRLDWERTEDTLITLQGDVYEGTVGSDLVLPVFTPPFSPRAVEQESSVSGGNLLARWREKSEDGSGTTVQAWLDLYDRDHPEVARERRGTADLELQHSFAPWGSHVVMVGASYRVTTDRIDGTELVGVTRRQRTDGIVGMFVNDELTLIPDRLTASAGVKLEYNSHSHFGYQPDLRVMFKPGRQHRLWAAASGALRSPSRAEEDMSIVVATAAGPGGLARVTQLEGNPTLAAEELWAFELGYRFQGGERLSVDMSAFHNTYEDLINFEVGTPFVDANRQRLVVPVRYVNGQAADSFGFELSANWRAHDHLTLSPTYTLFDLEFENGAAALPQFAQGSEGSSPTNQIGLRAAWTPVPDWEFGAAANYVDNLPSRGISSYVRLDTRIEWRVRDDLHLELVMQNLLDDRHPEFTGDLFSQMSEVERGVFFRLTARF